MKQFEFSLLFNFDSPPNLLYAIRERGRGPIPFQGISLASGKFLLEKFARPGDLFFFSVYEWQSGPITLGGNRPRTLRVDTRNFVSKSLFTSQPVFDEQDFRSQPVGTSDPPFPAVQQLVCWSTQEAVERPFQVVDVQEDTVFELSARLVVTPPIRSVPGRTFSFDPEMVVGPDGDP